MEEGKTTHSTITLLVYTDLSCPFCYLGERVLERLAQRWALELEWRPFEVHPELAPGGVELTEAGKERMAMMWRRVLWHAAALKVPMNLPEAIPNTSRGLAALLAAQAFDAEAASALRQALYEAVFIHGRNISAPADLVDIAKEALGQESPLLEPITTAVCQDSPDEALAKAQQEAKAAVVMGVPTIRVMVDGQERLDRRMMGAQPEEIFEKLFEDLQIPRVDTGAQAP